jgi:hypothetical protein
MPSLVDMTVFIGRKNARAVMVLDSPKFPRAKDKGMTISIGVHNCYVIRGVFSFGAHCMLQVMLNSFLTSSLAS